MLEVCALSAGYGSRAVLNRVSLMAPSGTVSVVLGPNGCGKSTLLKTICGILSPSEGEILVDGCSVLALESRQAAQKITYLAQNRQIPDISVGRLVLHGRFPYLEYPRRYGKADYAAANAAMERMGILNLAEEPLQTLSGGQRQKAYLAMALAQDTPVVLLDEPTTFLDVSHQLQMMEQARTLAAEGKTVLMVLHDLSLALQVADRVIVMDSGRIEATGTPQQVFDSKCLETVFGVRLGRVQTDRGWHYYYD